MEGHFKNKLLTISSGSFDGVYSFCFNIFSQEDDELQVLDRKLFSVKPLIRTLKTAEDKGENVLPYLVDMDLGLIAHVLLVEMDHHVNTSMLL